MNEIIRLNDSAISSLQCQNFQQCLQDLHRAESLLTPELISERPDLAAVTLNNLGCAYKKQGKLDQALAFLLHAEKVPGDRSNLVNTNLNICAVKSQQGRHEEALDYAHKALLTLKDLQSAKDDAKVRTGIIIAMHNIAVEYEFLSRIPQAIDMYKKAIDLASAHLGPKHSLSITLKESYATLTSNQIQFSKQRVLPLIHNKTRRRKRFHVSTAPMVDLSTSSINKRRPKSINQKLNCLERQLKDFSHKYEQLRIKHKNFVAEANSRHSERTRKNASFDLTRSSFTSCTNTSKEDADKKAHDAIRELEDLKKILKEENLLM